MRWRPTFSGIAANINAKAKRSEDDVPMLVEAPSLVDGIGARPHDDAPALSSSWLGLKTYGISGCEAKAAVIRLDNFPFPILVDLVRAECL